MTNSHSANRSSRRPHRPAAPTLLLCALFCGLAGVIASAQQPGANGPIAPALQYGPYNGFFLADGLGLSVNLAPTDTALSADAPWTLSCWVNLPEALTAPALVAGLGSLSAESPRYLRVEPGKLDLWLGPNSGLSGPADLAPGTWHLLAATFDGHNFALYADGSLVKSGPLPLTATRGPLQLAPNFQGPGQQHFGGQIAAFTVLHRALSAADIAAAYRARPDFSVIEFEEGSKPWVIQTRGQAGYRAPQPPATMPTQRGSYSAPSAIERPPIGVE